MLQGRWFAAGAVLGACLTAVYVTVVGTVPVNGSAGAQVRVLVGPTGALDVLPVGEVVAATDLRPGMAASGALSVRNQTARKVALEVAAPVGATGIDGGLVLTIEDGGRVAVHDTLRGLREKHRTDVLLAPGESKRLTVTTRLLDDSRGYEGVAVDVPLEVEAVPVDA